VHDAGDMSATAIIAIVLGALESAAGLALIFCKAKVLAAVKAFPRHQLAGRTLLMVDAAWCAYLIYITPFETLFWLKPYLYAFTPVAVYLIAKHLDDLLAPRALGGLYLLAASPLLKLIQWHDSPWRLVITVCLYIMVIKGMILIMFPYKFRTSCEYWLGHPGRLRIVTGMACTLGLLLLVIGFTVL